MIEGTELVLVLSGGNALGAFEAGVYEALHEHGLLPDRIVGASIGAINGALIAGTTPEQRVTTLRRFWQPERFGLAEPGTAWMPSAVEVARRTAAAGVTLATGRPGIFGPPLSSLSPWTTARPSVFETDQLATTLARMVDFDLINSGTCRYTATAVDLETGEDVIFDSRDQTIDPRHVRASAALPVAFPPVEIDGRWLVDGGLSANLPLDPVLAKPPLGPILCIAVDLLPLTGTLPSTIGEAATRMQDLIFAAQSRRSIDRWKVLHAGREEVRISLIRLAYAEQAVEVAGKALDFSGPTVAQRWAAGHAAGLKVVARIEEGTMPIDLPGVSLITDF